MTASESTEKPYAIKQLKNKVPVFQMKRKDTSPCRRIVTGEFLVTLPKPVRAINEVILWPAMMFTDSEVGAGGFDGWSSEEPA